MLLRLFLFCFSVYIWEILICIIFWTKIMGIQLNTFDTYWAYPPLASSSAPPSLLQCSTHRPPAPRPGTTLKLPRVEPPIENAVMVAVEGEGTDLREGVEILASGRWEMTKRASTGGAGMDPAQHGRDGWRRGMRTVERGRPALGDTIAVAVGFRSRVSRLMLRCVQSFN